MFDFVRVEDIVFMIFQEKPSSTDIKIFSTTKEEEEEKENTFDYG